MPLYQPLLLIVSDKGTYKIQRNRTEEIQIVHWLDLVKFALGGLICYVWMCSEKAAVLGH